MIHKGSFSFPVHARMNINGIRCLLSRKGDVVNMTDDCGNNVFIVPRIRNLIIDSLPDNSLVEVLYVSKDAFFVSDDYELVVSDVLKIEGHSVMNEPFESRISHFDSIGNFFSCQEFIMIHDEKELNGLENNFSANRSTLPNNCRCLSFLPIAPKKPAVL